MSENIPNQKKTETAIFGNGCFWCTEAVFQEVKGVEKVTSGYCGGHTANPTYEEVCSGSTGHAECLQIIYHPEVVSYEELLEIFWQTHDPTTLNRQGNDIGTQYRSAIFYLNESQKNIATAYMQQLEKAKTFSKPIVTTIEPYSKFYPAENYHQDYFNLHGNAPYCRYVIAPKVEKFKKTFKSKLKKGQ
jgi:peptide-methionine (S)-S-oxide reductase